ncbi:MAG TPA: hypothetical protein PK496_09725 [Bacteroidales bacterium]|nr:hypothetical protein [Bacteroidales bacterium]
MRKLCRPVQFLLISVIFILHSANSFSQVREKAVDSETDSLKNDTSSHSLYGGAGYGSNMIYLGSTISHDQPYSYAALSYGFKDSFYATVSSVHLTGMSPFFAFNTATLSYNHVFNSWFDIASGISYYHVAPSLADALFNSFVFGNLTAGIDWRLLYTKLSIGGLFSEDNSTFLQIRNSRYFQTPEFTSKKLFFTIDPYINVICGPLTTAETIEGSTIKLTPPYGKGGKKGQLTSTTQVSTKFSFLEIDFGIPVALNSERFILEAEPGYILPLYENDFSQETKGFLFSLSFYFRIL